MCCQEVHGSEATLLISSLTGATLPRAAGPRMPQKITTSLKPNRHLVHGFDSSLGTCACVPRQMSLPCIRERRQFDLSGRLVPTCATMLLVCMQVLTINPWLMLRQEKRPRATLVPNTRACQCIETRCHHLPFNHRATCASTLPSTLGKNRPRWMAGVASEPLVRWEKPLLCPYGRHFPGANAYSSGDLVRRCVPSFSPSLRIFVVMVFLFVRNIAGGIGIFHTKLKKSQHALVRLRPSSRNVKRHFFPCSSKEEFFHSTCHVVRCRYCGCVNRWYKSDERIM